MRLRMSDRSAGTYASVRCPECGISAADGSVRRRHGTGSLICSTLPALSSFIGEESSSIELDTDAVDLSKSSNSLVPLHVPELIRTSAFSVPTWATANSKGTCLPLLVAKVHHVLDPDGNAHSSCQRHEFHIL